MKKKQNKNSNKKKNKIYDINIDFQKDKIIFFICFLFFIISLVLFSLILIDGKIYFNKILFENKSFNENLTLKQKNLTNLNLLKNSNINYQNPIIGNINAKILMKIYVDFECPFLKKFNKILKKLKKNYIDLNLLKIEIITVPNIKIHKNSFFESKVFECINLQNKSLNFKIYNYLFENHITYNNLNENFYQEFKLNKNQIEKCLNNKEIENKILNNIYFLEQKNYSKNPIFIIDQIKFTTIKPYIVFKKIINDKLTKIN